MKSGRAEMQEKVDHRGVSIYMYTFTYIYNIMYNIEIEHD